LSRPVNQDVNATDGKTAGQSKEVKTRNSTEAARKTKLKKYFSF